MDISIKKLLDAKKNNKPKEAVGVVIFFREIFPNIEEKNIVFQKGVVFLKNLSPQKKTYIKLHGTKIKLRAKEKGVLIRDII